MDEKKNEYDNQATVKLFMDTFAEIKKKHVLHDGRITIKDLVDRYLRKGLGLGFIDRTAMELIGRAITHASTNASKIYLKRLEQHMGTIQQAVELSRREMRTLPEDWKENFDDWT